MKKKGALGVISRTPGTSAAKFFNYQQMDNRHEGIINGESVKSMLSAAILLADKDNLLLSLQNSINKKMKFKIDISDTPNPYDVIGSPAGYFRIITAICILFPVLGIIHIIYVLKRFFFINQGKQKKSYLLMSLLLVFIGNIVRIVIFIDLYGVNNAFILKIMFTTTILSLFYNELQYED